MQANDISKEVYSGVAKVLQRSKEDWRYFAKVVLGVNLDPEQEEILHSFQHNKMTSVASGTARGKDFVSAVAAMCFLYLTPTFVDGKLTGNTKVILTAPTDRQVLTIMMPEISRLYKRMVANGFGFMGGRLHVYGIKTEYEEWFLIGFKADEHNHEAWSGLHAVRIAFIVTEGSGVADTIFDAIEGNLQGDSRLMIVFNYNRTTGYAARSQSSPRWSKFRLNSMNAPNVIEKRVVIPGQVDYEWVKDKVETWCQVISKAEINLGEGDFEWEGSWYRPNDLFRIKVLGMGPKESSDTLIPRYWIELAVNRWRQNGTGGKTYSDPLRLGADVAGMGRDSSCLAHRYGDYVEKFDLIHSGGKADHMAFAGKIKTEVESYNIGAQRESDQRGKRLPKAVAMVDTIGEGAGVFSRLEEQKVPGIFSCKFSEAATDEQGNSLKDITGQLEFANMRAYLFWAVRDWLDPDKGSNAMVPPDDGFLQEAAEIHWKFQSNGKIIIEPKEDIKKRLGRSPDKLDALASTFYPFANHKPKLKLTGFFH